MKKVAWLFLALNVVSIMACSLPVKINLISAAQLNTDQKNNSLPVEVHISQLQNKDAFIQASFHQLWKNETHILGADLLSTDTYTVTPSSTQTIKLNVAKGAKYLGFIGIFRSPEQQQWKALCVLPNSLISLIFPTAVILEKNKIKVGI